WECMALAAERTRGRGGSGDLQDAHPAGAQDLGVEAGLVERAQRRSERREVVARAPLDAVGERAAVRDAKADMLDPLRGEGFALNAIGPDEELRVGHVVAH